MLEKHAEDWKDKVRIIGVSIDDNMADLKKHVESKGWGLVEHFHEAKGKCSDVYGVKGVPHVMIVDQNGKIVFKGHPSGRKNLE